VNIQHGHVHDIDLIFIDTQIKSITCCVENVLFSLTDPTDQSMNLFYSFCFQEYPINCQLDFLYSEAGVGEGEGGGVLRHFPFGGFI
jgi:hypothetical protein